jgi:hypothetical protein
MILRPASISSSVLRSRASAPTRLVNGRTEGGLYGGRPFSQSVGRHDSPPQNHYQTLKISPHATPAELKKQFYVLSKETHPDVNPNNPEAGKRFAAISESYSVLANPEKRKRYDRDVMRHQQHQHRHSHGSHSSHQRATSTGHRAPSGLSKRRSAFKGPPPSFYAHGKPSANTTHQARAGGPNSDPQYTAGTFNAGAYTEEGRYDPEFDPRSTYKTQTLEDYRRANRRAAEMAAAQAAVEQDDFWARFVVVSTIIVLSISLGSLIVARANGPKGGLTRSDGSRRDGGRNEWTKG